MNWMSLVLAGAAGALAAGLAALFVRPKENKNAFGVTFVILFAGLYFASKTYVLPWWEMHQLEDEFETIPAYKAIQEHDREAYRELMSDVRKALKGRRHKNQLIGIVRNHTAAIVEKRLPTATDEAVVDYMNVIMEETKILYERGDDLCFRLMFPQPGDLLDGTQYFPQDVQKRDLAALAQVIETSARTPQEVPDEDDVTPVLIPVFQKLAGQFGEEVGMMQNPTAPGVDRRKVCEMVTSMYDKILEMPVRDSGRIFRYLLAQ